MAKKSNSLEVALGGTLIIASSICIKLWLIMGEIDMTLNDPMAMAFIITDNGIKSDSSAAETKLNEAAASFHDTEKMLAVFSVCLVMIGIALIVRVFKRSYAKR